MNEAQNEGDISKYMLFISNTSHSIIYKLLNYKSLLDRPSIQIN